MMPVLPAIVSPVGRPVAENVSGVCPVAGMANRNGAPGLAPTTKGGWMRGVAGGAAIDMVIVVVAAETSPPIDDRIPNKVADSRTGKRWPWFITTYCCVTPGFVAQKKRRSDDR